MAEISAFKEKFVISTIPEFIAAGDYLAGEATDWTWASGKSSKRNTNLPNSKQYLSLRNVPYPGVAISPEEEYVIVDEAEVPDPGVDLSPDEDYVIVGEESKNDDEELPETFLKTDFFQIIESYFDVGIKEKSPDMEKSINICPETQESTQRRHRVGHDPEVNKCSITCEIMITYDEDHNAPHFWVIGYHEGSRILRPELILDSLVKHDVGKTVTIEDHPYLPGKHVSVHPRLHGAAVKRVGHACVSRRFVPDVKKCLFQYLEQFSSLFPLIKHDCNMCYDPQNCAKYKRCFQKKTFRNLH